MREFFPAHRPNSRPTLTESCRWRSQQRSCTCFHGALLPAREVSEAAVAREAFGVIVDVKSPVIILARLAGDSAAASAHGLALHVIAELFEIAEVRADPIRPRGEERLDANDAAENGSEGEEYDPGERKPRHQRQQVGSACEREHDTRVCRDRSQDTQAP